MRAVADALELTNLLASPEALADATRDFTNGGDA
jgi:hypothetical protein